MLMNRFPLRHAFVALMACAAAAVSAADIPDLVQTQCAACHGLNGQSTLPGAPNISGQKQDYLERQLKAYRSGERQNEQMSVVSKGLSDEDIAVISAWYASIEVKVQEVSPF